MQWLLERQAGAGSTRSLDQHRTSFRFVPILHEMKEHRMNKNGHATQNPVGTLLSLLPPYPGSLLFAAGLNLALARHLPRDVQQFLSEKIIRIRVIDAQLAFDFQWRKNAFSACRNSEKIDLTIAASARDFLLLAQRKEDPDTLFFSRRLVMEGDTELGLLVKNTLDAIDLPVFDPGRLSPAGMLARLRSTIKRAAGPAN